MDNIGTPTGKARASFQIESRLFKLANPALPGATMSGHKLQYFIVARKMALE